MSADPIVIVGMARTPMGGLLGELSGYEAYELGAVAIKAALDEAKVDGGDVQQVLMGNCLMAGQGQAPARQAAITAGLPVSAQATTLSKMCGSGMHAAVLGRALIASGEADIIVAGGMESMTNAPFMLPKMRAGHKYGAGQVLDHMALDGLEDAYDGLPMGFFADRVAKEYQFSREAQDAYALETLRRAQDAAKHGRFKRETAVPLPGVWRRKL